VLGPYPPCTPWVHDALGHLGWPRVACTQGVQGGYGPSALPRHAHLHPKVGEGCPGGSLNCQKKTIHGKHCKAEEQCTFMAQILAGFVTEMGMSAVSKTDAKHRLQQYKLFWRAEGHSKWCFYGAFPTEMCQKTPCARPRVYQAWPPDSHILARNRKKRVKHIYECFSNGKVLRNGLRTYLSSTYRKIPRFQLGISEMTET